MNAVPHIVFNEDASPLARVLAKSLSHALLTPDGARLLKAIDVPFAIKSSKGAQAVTIDATNDSVEVKNGIGSDTSIIIALDLDNPAIKPDIEKGLIFHPLNLYRISQLLSLPAPEWQESARTFWSQASTAPDTPDGLKLTNLSDGSQLDLGDTSEENQVVEIHGKTEDLQSLLSGQSLFAADLMAGKLRYRGTLKHLATLSAVGQSMLLSKAHE